MTDPQQPLCSWTILIDQQGINYIKIFTVGLELFISRNLFGSFCILHRKNCRQLYKGCYSVGCLEKVVFNLQQLAALNELIGGAAVNVVELYRFKKMIYRKQLFYSKSCTKVKTRNSYTVIYLASNGVFKVGRILHFLKVVLAEDFLESNLYGLAAVEELEPCHNEEIMAGIDVSTFNTELGSHLKPLGYQVF